jgi:hypothetical protein
MNNELAADGVEKNSWNGRDAPAVEEGGSSVTIAASPE